MNNTQIVFGLFLVFWIVMIFLTLLDINENLKEIKDAIQQTKCPK